MEDSTGPTQSWADAQAWHQEYAAKRAEYLKAARTCRHCGVRRGGHREHYLRSPKCWALDQAILKKDCTNASYSNFRQHWRRRCLCCGTPFYNRVPAKICIPCVIKRAAERQKQRRQAEKHPVTCGHCCREFLPSRKDTAYCSAACRQAAHRKRHTAGVTDIESVTRLALSRAVTANVEGGSTESVTAIEMSRRQDISRAVTANVEGIP